MNRRVKHVRRQLRPVEPPADQPPADQPPADDQPAQAPNLNGLRLDAGVIAAQGPDGRMWPAIQHQQGAMGQVLMLPPENVEQWLRVIGRDLRAVAADCVARNGGTPAARSRLIIAGPQDVPRFPSA